MLYSGGTCDNKVGPACAKAEIKQNSLLSAQFGSEFKTVLKWCPLIRTMKNIEPLRLLDADKYKIIFKHNSKE